MTRMAAPTAFAYLAVRPGGGRKFGIRQAQSEPALAKTLRAENQLLLRSWKVPAWAASEPTLGLKDQAALNEQLAQLLTRGVPLVEALDVVAESVKPNSRPRLRKLRDAVAAGSSFADACKMVGGFDNVTIAVYRGAERTGELGPAAKELSTTMRRRLAMGNKAATLMVYPVIVLSISAVVSFIMLVGVVPQLGEAMRQGDVELPAFSKVVMGLGQWMRDNFSIVLLLILSALVAAYICRKLIVKGLALLMRKVPIMKDVVLAQECARFFSVMAAMTRTGVPLGDALAVANQAVTHPLLRQQLDRLRTRLIEGGMLRVLIDEVSAFPVATRRLLIASERSGDLETAFGTLAADTADEVDRRSARLLAAMEPVLTVLMFLVIGTLLMSIMLPMLTLTSKMKV